MNIRSATADDADAMAALWLTTALTAYAPIFPPDAPLPTQAQNAALIRRDFDEQGCRGFVAEGDELVGMVGLVGMVMTGAWPGDPGVGRFHRLYVDPSSWQRGIGRQLHDRAVDALSDSGFATARLWVLRDNERARGFYERRGWKPTGEIAVVHGDVIDVQYERALAPSPDGTRG